MENSLGEEGFFGEGGKNDSPSGDVTNPVGRTGEGAGAGAGPVSDTRHCQLLPRDYTSATFIPSSNVMAAELVYDLPPFSECEDPCFTWDTLNNEEAITAFDNAYNEAVHWRRNISLPSVQAGKKLVLELARLFRSFADPWNESLSKRPC